jgi:hypothetical protein
MKTIGKYQHDFKRAGLIKTLAALTKILDVRPYSIMLWGKFFVEKLVASQ